MMKLDDAEIAALLGDYAVFVHAGGDADKTQLVQGWRAMPELVQAIERGSSYQQWRKDALDGAVERAQFLGRVGDPIDLRKLATYTLRVQTKLIDHGFFSGPADARPGPSTRQALREFQRKHSLPPTGVVDRATALTLQWAPPS